MEKATARSTLPPMWMLNTSPAPAHMYELLVSGLNTLLPVRQVVRKQSQAKHSEVLQKYSRTPPVAGRASSYLSEAGQQHRRDVERARELHVGGGAPRQRGATRVCTQNWR